MSNRFKYTKEVLEPIVQRSQSISDVLIELGLVVKGGNFATIKRALVRLEIDYSHFTGLAWAKGLTKETCDAILTQVSNNPLRRTAEEALVEGSNITSSTLRRLFKEVAKEERCSECFIGTSYNGKSLVLHVDHINGVSNDNRPTNLRYLCPNCHSQTETYCGRNIKNRRV